MNQQILDNHIGSPPPSTIDVEQIIKRQRRTGALLRVAAGGSAVAVTALAIAVGAALVGGPRSAAPPSIAASTPSTNAPTPTDASVGLRLETDDEASIARTRDSLRVALERAMSASAPGVSLIYMPDVPGEDPLPDGHPAMGVERNRIGFTARSGLARNGHKSGLYMQVRPASCEPGQGCQSVYSCDRHTYAACATSTTLAGLALVEATEQWPGGGRQYVFYIVQIKLRPDYWLTMEAVNYFGGDGSPVSVTTPLLSKAELKAVASTIADEIVS